jgi:glutamyl-tRNA synthetase
LPLILAPTGKGKLSKRHGGVEVRGFRRAGYLPEAMVNYLARVGWSYDDKTEIFGRDELIRFFDLSGVNSSPARFSYERLEWMNGYYIRQLDAGDLSARLVPFMVDAGFDVTDATLRPIVPLVQERLKTLSDVVDWAGFFFEPELEYDPRLLIGKKMTASQSMDALQQARSALDAQPDLTPDTTEPLLRALASDAGLKAGQLFGVVRVAVTGRTVAPPLFETMTVLGKTRAMERIDRAIEALSSLET